MSKNEYEVVSMLGKGGYAAVVEVKDKNGNLYALKKPFHEKQYLKNSCGVINMKELYIMASIKHPYIQSALKVHFVDPCPMDNLFIPADQGYDRMFFLMTKAEYTCHELVHKFRAPISHVKRAMFQISCAVHYLHTKAICHRDLKPGNFLCYYSQGVLTAKLTDFGMTKPMNFVNRNSLHAGTLYYRAPELIMQNMEYGFAMDIWSLGCSFFEMVSRKPLFKAATDMELIQTIFQKRGSPGNETYRNLSSPDFKVSIGNFKKKTIRSLLALDQNSRALFDAPVVDNLLSPGKLDQFCDLLEKMLVLNPAKRYTMDQVIKHPFFSEFFIPHPQQFNLWLPKFEKEPVPIQFFPKEHPLWSIGANEFIGIDPSPTKYDEELAYSVRFHGLDIYNRFLLRIRPVKDKKMYKKIAWCCGYIASKYFLDELSDFLWDIFPSSLGCIEIPEIVEIERRILQILEFEIFSLTCYSFLKYRSFYATLFALMIKDDKLYGKPIDQIMKIFNEGVSLQLQTVPPHIPLK
jgi:serine/threonine protein kinase